MKKVLHKRKAISTSSKKQTNKIPTVKKEKKALQVKKSGVQDSSYWVSRPLDDKERDWDYGAENWIKDYTASKTHPHRTLIIQELRKFPWSYLLEMGCSSGPNLKLIRENFPDKALFGIDVNRDVIEEARLHLDSAVDLRVADAIKTPFGDLFFDVTLIDAVLLYIGPEKISKILEEINRITKNFVVLVERYADSYGGKAVGHVWGRNYKILFEKLGFEVNEISLTTENWPTSKNWQKYGRIWVGRRI